MIYSLYGQPSSGKTSIGNLISAKFEIPSCNVIDGDVFRGVFHNTDYSEDGRRENIKKANAVATYLHVATKKSVVISLVNPYEDLRKELKTLNNDKVTEIFLHSSRTEKKEFHVEQFQEGSPDFKFNTDRSVVATWDKICSKVFYDGESRFVPYGPEWFDWRENSLRPKGKKL